jgi:hypothetical protein
MARLPALVAALAEEDDRDAGTLNLVARTVREAGHMATTKRGVGAAGMTVRDAANLLIGAYGAESPKEAPAAVAMFRTLRNQRQEKGREGVVGHLDAADSFGEALEALIAGTPELCTMFLQYVEEAYSDQPSHVQRTFALGLVNVVGVDVTLHRPSPFATIEIWRSDGGQRTVDFAWRFLVDSNLFMQGFYPQRRGSRSVRVTFGLQTLMKVSAVLLDDGALMNAASNNAQ